MANDLSGLPKHLHGSCKPADLPLTGEQYQHLAGRTECDQLRSRMRISGSLGHIKDPTNLPLLDGGPSNNSIPLIPIRFNHAIVGMAGEVGELSSLLERWVYYGKDLDVNKVAEEVGDVLWYVAELCNTFGLNMSTIMAANIAKLKARYPEKYTDEAAANRDLEAEKQAREKAMSATVGGTLRALESTELGERFLKVGGIESPAGTVDNPHKHHGHDTTEKLSGPPEMCNLHNPLTPRKDTSYQDGHGFGHSDPGEMSQGDGI